MRAAAALVVASAFAADWNQFRGPSANPAVDSQNLPDRWSSTQGIEWSAELPGRGWSSPVVAGRLVFLTSVVTEGKSKPPQSGTDYSNEYAAELAKQGLSEKEILAKVTERDIELPHEVTLHYFLYCLDLQTGAIRWKREFHSGRPPGGRHRKNSFSSETPVTDGERVFVYVGNLGLYSFNLRGDLLWSAPLESHPIYLDFGTGSSPVLHGDRVFILSDNQDNQFLAAFDKRTGKQIWRTRRELSVPANGSQRSGWATPYLWSSGKRTEIVTVGPGAAVSYDLAGKELWRLKGMTAAPTPSPFAANGLLFIDGGQARPIFAVRPGATGDITPAEGQRTSEYVAWSEPRTGTYMPTPVAYQGALYVLFDKGILARLDAATGKQTYRERIQLDAGAFTSSPWAYGGKIFCLNEEGKTFVLAAGEKFQLLHVNELDGAMALATPAIAGDRLLLRTENRLYSIRRPRP